MKKGESLTIMKLTGAFGRYAVPVLRGQDYIEDAERKRGAPRRFKVLKDLPDLEAFAKLQAARYTTTLASLVDEARGEAESLRDECQEWYDNLPEAFQQGDKGSQLEEAVSNLENISVDDLATELGEMSVVYLPSLECDSRRDRASEAACKFRAVAEELRELATKIEEQQNAEDDEEDNEEAGEEEADEDEEEKKLEGDPVEINQIADDLENAADELDNVEFPGMY
jgi:hypothetical protein